MRLSDLQKQTKTVMVEINGETAEVEYRLHAITPALLSEIQHLEDIDKVTYQIEKTVKRWEVLDDEGKEIPTTHEAILEYQIPLDFLTAVLNAIIADMKSGEEEKNA